MKHKRPGQRFWETHIEGWQKSELSQQAYCKEHNLKASTFFYWKRKLSAPETTNSVNLVEITNQGHKKNLAEPPSIKITIGTQFSIILEKDFNPELLARVVNTLRGLA